MDNLAEIFKALYESGGFEGIESINNPSLSNFAVGGQFLENGRNNFLGGNTGETGIQSSLPNGYFEPIPWQDVPLGINQHNLRGLNPFAFNINNLYPEDLQTPSYESYLNNKDRQRVGMLENPLPTDAVTQPLSQDNSERNERGILDILNNTPNTANSYSENLFKLGQSIGFTPSNSIQGRGARSAVNSANAVRGISALGDVILGGARDISSGLAYQRKNQKVQDEFAEKKRLALINQGTSLTTREDGGTIDFRDILKKFANGGQQVMQQDQRQREFLPSSEQLTGEYIQQGMNPDVSQQGAVPEQANAEVESGEYVQHPDGSTQKVVGNTHEQGGERLDLEDKTKVISDNLKLGAKNARVIKTEFDINVKASDTYASVVDKFTSKIGLKTLNSEQVELFNKLAKNESVKDRNTLEVNEQFISEKLNSIEEKKKMLEDARSQFTNFIFELQEESKGVKSPIAQEEGVAIPSPSNVEGQDPQMTQGLGQEAPPMEQGMPMEQPLQTGQGMPMEQPPQMGQGMAGGEIPPEIMAYLQQQQQVPPQELPQGRVGGLFNINKGSAILGPDGEPEPETGKETILDEVVIKKSKPKVVVAQSKTNPFVLPTKGSFVPSNLPDDSPILPSALSSHMKSSIRLNTTQPFIQSYDNSVNELVRQRNAALSQMNGLTATQKSAVLSNLDAEINNKISEVMSNVDSQNAQSIYKNNVENARTQQAEDTANVNMASAYEQSQMTALAKTEQDYQDYLEQNRVLRSNRFKYLQREREIFDMMKNIHKDANGNLVIDPNSSPLLSVGNLSDVQREMSNLYNPYKTARERQAEEKLKLEKEKLEASKSSKK